MNYFKLLCVLSFFLEQAFSSTCIAMDTNPLEDPNTLNIKKRNIKPLVLTSNSSVAPPTPQQIFDKLPKMQEIYYFNRSSGSQVTTSISSLSQVEGDDIYYYYLVLQNFYLNPVDLWDGKYVCDLFSYPYILGEDVFITDCSPESTQLTTSVTSGVSQTVSLSAGYMQKLGFTVTGGYSGTISNSTEHPVPDLRVSLNKPPNNDIVYSYTNYPNLAAVRWVFQLTNESIISNATLTVGAQSIWKVKKSALVAKTPSGFQLCMQDTQRNFHRLKINGKDFIESPSDPIPDPKLIIAYGGVGGGKRNLIHSISSTDGVSWKQERERTFPGVLNRDGTHSPALASFKNNLYCAVDGITDKVYVHSTVDGESWLPSYPVDSLTISYSPSLASFNQPTTDWLYLAAHKSASASPTGEIWYSSTSNGKDWNPWEQISTISNANSSPSLFVFNTKLCCAYLLKNGSVMCTANSMQDTEGNYPWGEAQAIPGVKVGGAEAPSFAVFNDKLYCAYQNDRGELYYTSSPKDSPPQNPPSKDSTSEILSWNDPQSIPGVKITSAPALSVFDNRLYCVYQKYGQLWYTSTDGKFWNVKGTRGIDSQIKWVSSTTPPAIATFAINQ